GVKLPNNSAPSSIAPFPFLSRASHASSVPSSVQDRRSRVPSLLRSKFTPVAALVMLKPFPLTSTRIGVPPQHPKLVVVGTQQGPSPLSPSSSGHSSGNWPLHKKLAQPSSVAGSQSSSIPLKQVV